MVHKTDVGHCANTSFTSALATFIKIYKQNICIISKFFSFWSLSRLLLCWRSTQLFSLALSSSYSISSISISRFGGSLDPSFFCYASSIPMFQIEHFNTETPHLLDHIFGVLLKQLCSTS